MQYTPALALALALGVSAAPQPQFSGWGAFQPPPYPPGTAPPVPGSSGSPVPSSAPSPPIATGTGDCSAVYVTPSASAPVASSSAAVPVEVSSAGAVSSVVVPSYSVPVAGPSSVADPISSAVAASSAAAGSSAPAASSSSVAPKSSAAASSTPSSITASVSVPSGGASSGGGLPASSGSSALSAVQTIAAGESFDCGMVMYDRGVSCTGQEEGGDSDAVFELESGATLSNCIIGPNQIEGVHCNGGCTLKNVWWSAVCEDAFSIKEQDAGETTTIIGGGAFGAEDKVLQHNGAGTVSVSGFTVDNFGKLYRSCGNCDDMYERHVIMDDITATGGSELAGINSNYGDTATFTNIKVSDVDDICVTYTGNDTGDEPEENGSGPSDSCLYSESDVTNI